jgi:hypothetical protein
MAIAPPHPRQQQVMVEDSTIRQVIWLNPRDIPEISTGQNKIVSNVTIIYEVD